MHVCRQQVTDGSRLTSRGKKRIPSYLSWMSSHATLNVYVCIYQNLATIHPTVIYGTLQSKLRAHYYCAWEILTSFRPPVCIHLRDMLIINRYFCDKGVIDMSHITREGEVNSSHSSSSWTNIHGCTQYTVYSQSLAVDISTCKRLQSFQ